MFFRKFINNRNKKTEVVMNKTIHLGLSVLEISKIAMYDFQYYYVIPKYREKAK